MVIMTFVVVPGIVDHEGYMVALVESAATNQSTGFFTVRVGPASDGSTIINVQEREKALALAKLFCDARECEIRILANPSDEIMRLPLPIAPGFEALFLDAASRV